MTRNLIIIVFCICIVNSYSQNDSIKESSSHTYLTPRYSMGMQNSIYAEMGLSRLGLINKGISFGSWCLYSALEINYRTALVNSKFYYGVKCGYETSWVIGMWALEIKYLSDFSKSQLVFTPKIGLSIGGFINLLYGYNFPNKFLGLIGLGHHQISLIANLNRKIINKEFKSNH